MVEADIHLRPLYTSIVDIFKAFEPLVCTVSRAYGCTHTVTPSKPGIQIHLRSGGNDATIFEADIHLRPLHTSIVDIYKVFEPFACCLKGIPVYCYTGQVGPRFGDSGSLNEWWK
jgi:hypothetical protein